MSIIRPEDAFADAGQRDQLHLPVPDTTLRNQRLRVVRHRFVTTTQHRHFQAQRLVAIAGGVPGVDSGSGSGVETVEVVAPRALEDLPVSSTEGYVTAEQLAERPIARSGEPLEFVPGLMVTQHSGGGKANHYFLRGFNVDHGTDFYS